MSGSPFGCGLISFLCNHNFKEAFIIAKYLGCEMKPYQEINILRGKNASDYYYRSSKKGFLKVLLIGENISDLETLLRQMSGGSHRLNFKPYWLLARPNGQKLIVKTYTVKEINEGINPTANFSNFDVMWIFANEEDKLNKFYRRIFNKLPREIPRIGITDKVWSGRLEDSTKDEELRLKFGLGMSADLDDRTINSLVSQSMNALKSLRVSTPEGPHWIGEGHDLLVTSLFGIGLLTVAAYGFYLYKTRSKH